MLRTRSLTVVLVAWTFLVWTTRLRNVWGDADLSDGEKWGRTGLALSLTALAIAVVAGLVRRAGWTDVAVKALAGWTIGVWVVRSFGIATTDHAAAFVVVHLVLAAVSVGLAVVAVREGAPATVDVTP